MRITLTNNFHNTRTAIIPKPITGGRYKGFYKVSLSSAKRAKNKLCGSDSCTCGGNFGERSENYLELINMDDSNFIIKL